MIESLNMDIQSNPTSQPRIDKGPYTGRSHSELEGKWKYLGGAISSEGKNHQHEIMSNLDKYKHRVGRTFNDGVVSYWIWKENG